MSSYENHSSPNRDSQITDMLLEVAHKALAFIVDGLVNAEVLLEPGALVRSTGDGNDLASLDLGDLTDDAAYGPCCTGHDDGLAGLWLCDVEETLHVWR